jgi:hypothetical protein
VRAVRARWARILIFVCSLASVGSASGACLLGKEGIPFTKWFQKDVLLRYACAIQEQSSSGVHVWLSRSQQSVGETRFPNGFSGFVNYATINNRIQHIMRIDVSDGFNGIPSAHKNEVDFGMHRKICSSEEVYNYRVVWQCLVWEHRPPYYHMLGGGVTNIILLGKNSRFITAEWGDTRSGGGKNSRRVPNISKNKMEWNSYLHNYIAGFIDEDIGTNFNIHWYPCAPIGPHLVQLALHGGDGFIGLLVGAAQSQPLQDRSDYAEKTHNYQKPSRTDETTRYRYQWGFVGGLIICAGAALPRLAMELFHKADEASRFSPAAWATFLIGGASIVHGLISIRAQTWMAFETYTSSRFTACRPIAAITARKKVAANVPRLSFAAVESRVSDTPCSLRRSANSS